MLLLQVYNVHLTILKHNVKTKEKNFFEEDVELANDRITIKTKAFSILRIQMST